MGLQLGTDGVAKVREVHAGWHLGKGRDGIPCLAGRDAVAHTLPPVCTIFPSIITWTKSGVI